MICRNMVARGWRSARAITCALLIPGACCPPNQAPGVPALEVIVVDENTGGPPSSDVVVRATLKNLPAFELTLQSPQVVGYIGGNGPGTYQVEVTAQGYQDWTRSVRVEGRCMDTKLATVLVSLTPRT